MADVSVEDAVTRNCEALVAGNISQIFIDMTPEAMAKLSTLSASQGAARGMPKLTAYEIIGREADGADHLYDVRFSGDVAFGVKGRWREVNGAWKLVDFEGYQIEGA